MPKKLSIEDVYKHLINKQLEKHGVDFDYVLEHQTINGVEWFEHYAMSESEFDEFKAYAIDFIKKNMRRMYKGYFDKVFDSFILMYGLQIEKQ